MIKTYNVIGIDYVRHVTPPFTKGIVEQGRTNTLKFMLECPTLVFFTYSETPKEEWATRSLYILAKFGYNTCSQQSFIQGLFSTCDKGPWEIMMLDFS